MKVRTELATLVSLACTWYVPGRADDATVTQPGRLMVRFLARVVVVTISILIHTESMQAAGRGRPAGLYGSLP